MPLPAERLLYTRPCPRHAGYFIFPEVFIKEEAKNPGGDRVSPGDLWGRGRVGAWGCPPRPSCWLPRRAWA